MSLSTERLQSAESLAKKLEKNKLLLISGFTVFYSVCTYAFAKRQFLWNDELYTYYIALLPTMSDVWGALMAGGEQLPPFFYIVTRAAIALFGVNNAALRLPEMIGFGVMCVCLFVFVARRASNFYGLLAAIFPMLTGAYLYAYEARPYGMVLGFGALALLCWQSAATNRFRTLSIVCLAASLAGALSSHYYGIFVVLPLILGEAVRTSARRRVDVFVWAAFAFAAAPLVWHLPLIARARDYSGTFWATPEWMQIPDFYSNLLGAAIIPLLVLLFFVGIYAAFRRDADSSNPATAAVAPPIYEVAAAVGFILIPFVCVILAQFVTGAFTNRYALPAVIGFGVLIPFIAARSFKNAALPAAALIVLFIGWFGLTQYEAVREVSSNPYLKRARLFASERQTDLPIVAAEPHTFIEFVHYGAPELTSRVVYLADPEMSLKHMEHNSVERGMVDLLKPWFKLNVVDYQSFILSRPRFLVYGKLGFLNWIVPQLKEEGMRIELLANEDEMFLFLVYPAEQTADSSSPPVTEPSPAR